jgi:hypothetical protein
MWRLQKEMSDKIKKNRIPGYIIGPFRKAAENIEAFGISMYYSHYCQSALDSLAKTQEEYKAAVRAEDVEEIDAKADEIKFYNELLEMVTSLQLSTDKDKESSAIND